MLCVALDLGTLCSDIDADWQAGRLAGLHVVTDIPTDKLWQMKASSSNPKEGAVK